MLVSRLPIVKVLLGQLQPRLHCFAAVPWEKKTSPHLTTKPCRNGFSGVLPFCFSILNIFVDNAEVYVDCESIVGNSEIIEWILSLGSVATILSVSCYNVSLLTIVEVGTSK